MAPKTFLVCLLILAVAYVEAGKHPKATKIKKGKRLAFSLIFLDLRLRLLINHCKRTRTEGIN